MTTEGDFRRYRKRLDNELGIQERVADEIIGMTARRTRAEVEAAGRQWAENCFTDGPAQAVPLLAR